MMTAIKNLIIPPPTLFRRDPAEVNNEGGTVILERKNSSLRSLRFFSVFCGCKGQGLVAAVAIMLILALFGLVGVSLIGTQTGQSATGLVQSTQALFLAHAGIEWYMQQLADDNDWTDQVNPSAKTLGAGTFIIQLSNITANSMDIKSTGRVAGPDGINRERWLSVTVKKIYAHCDFVVFLELDQNPRVVLATAGPGTQISGDVWSRASMRINSPSSVTNGLVYYAQGEVVDGSGSYISSAVSSPFPALPVIDTTTYDNLMIDWNTRITEAGNLTFSWSGGNLNLTSNQDWTNQTINARNINTNGYDITGTDFTVNCRAFILMNNSEIDANASNFTINAEVGFQMQGNSRIDGNSYRINSRSFNLGDSGSSTATINSQDFKVYLKTGDFDTNGNIGIIGYGYIVTSQNGRILLHHANADTGTFTATPSGGSIYFVSGNTMIVDSTQSDTYVNLNSGCYLYSRSATGQDEYLDIRNDNTAINNAVIIGERRIIIEGSADIANSVVYVPYASTSNNNYLRVIGSGTTFSGTVICRGRANPSLRINSGAAITGFVYQYGDSTDGSAQINDGSSIIGALKAQRLYQATLGPGTLTYDYNSIPAVSGFSSFEVHPQENSWDGL